MLSGFGIISKRLSDELNGVVVAYGGLDSTYRSSLDFCY